MGADNTSAQWLQQNREKLITLNATGLVVNVRTLAELNQLREIVPEIIMLPIPGDDLAERIGIAHYPALITETGVSQ
ncbi:PFL_4695 family integrating conjugative element protein [Mannheimia haemolytica]|uniref:PFL_4695 family integrating conjugative element protein n=1 Tax=Mannheimia haemolytica TaxID=75985 RepID=UPI0023AA212C|nr:integrating conjugative element protein [Mannheimia haemolytica]